MANADAFLRYKRETIEAYWQAEMREADRVAAMWPDDPLAAFDAAWLRYEYERLKGET